MSFEEQLVAGLEGTVVVMGIGNPMRGDDGAGSLAARGVLERPGVRVLDARDVPEEHVVEVVSQRPDTIILIDCVEMNAEPGSVAFLESEQIGEYWPSTHRMPMSVLMRVLSQETQTRVVGIGIQPAHTEFLKPMSTAVAESAVDLARLLNDALARGRKAAQVVAAGCPEREVPA